MGFELDTMDSIRSWRTRQAAADMHTVLSPFHSRKIPGEAEVHSRAAARLNTVESVNALADPRSTSCGLGAMPRT
jgi:hypothetical protein